MHPWASEPTPGDFVRACVDRFARVAPGFVRACVDRFARVAPGGWELDEYTCRATNVSYNWSRGGSNVAMLMAIQPHAQIDGNGDHATYVEPMSLQPAGDDVIDGVHGVRLRMLSAFQLLDIGLTIAPQAATATQKNGAAPAPAPSHHGAVAAPAWNTWHLSAQLGEVRPDSLIKYLDEPGVRVETISYKSGQWALDGVLYEK
ncbi:MAG: type 4b pilus protein PilO2 [Pararobbsia sp.]